MKSNVTVDGIINYTRYVTITNELLYIENSFESVPKTFDRKSHKNVYMYIHVSLRRSKR